MKPTFAVGACVRVARDLPEIGIVQGAFGAVVAVFGAPALAYEIEFVDDNGATIATFPIHQEDLAPLEPSAHVDARR